MEIELKVEASANKTEVQVSESRGKKKGGKGNLRSKMLRVVMPILSRELGEKLAKAIDAKDREQVIHVMDQVKQQLADKIGTSRKK
jgi:hypothetical protein